MSSLRRFCKIPIRIRSKLIADLELSLAAAIGYRDGPNVRYARIYELLTLTRHRPFRRRMMSSPNQRPADLAAEIAALSFDRIARRIGIRLREMYGAPEANPLPVEHVDLLLRLRQKERDQARLRNA